MCGLRFPSFPSLGEEDKVNLLLGVTHGVHLGEVSIGALSSFACIHWVEVTDELLQHPRGYGQARLSGFAHSVSLIDDAVEVTSWVRSIMAQKMHLASLFASV